MDEEDMEDDALLKNMIPELKGDFVPEEEISEALTWATDRMMPG